MRLIAAIKCRNYAPLHAGDLNQSVRVHTPHFFSHCLTFSCEGSECAEQMRDTQHDYVLD